MGTDVRVDVTVQRPRSAVAALMFEPTNDVAWTSGVLGVRPLTG
jgi:hypothetical protein